MRDKKQTVPWVLLPMAISAIVGIAVPNLAFGETSTISTTGQVRKSQALGIAGRSKERNATVRRPMAIGTTLLSRRKATESRPIKAFCKASHANCSHLAQPRLRCPKGLGRVFGRNRAWLAWGLLQANSNASYGRVLAAACQ
jgi:hypothetical protein